MYNEKRDGGNRAVAPTCIELIDEPAVHDDGADYQNKARPQRRLFYGRSLLSPLLLGVIHAVPSIGFSRCLPPLQQLYTTHYLASTQTHYIKAN